MKRQYQVGILLLAITIFGFLLRIYHLDATCVTFDENYTNMVASKPVTDLIYFTFSQDTNTVTYYTLAHVAKDIFGSTITALRVPAMIFGTLTIPAAYFLGKEYKNEIVGILCAFSVAISFPMIFYSQNARPYSLIMLALIICLYFFIKVYRGDATYLSLFACFVGICMWSHIYSVFPLSILCLAILYKYRMKFVPYLILIALWCTPFLLYYKYNATHNIVYGYGETWSQFIAMLPSEMFAWAWVVMIPLFMYAIYHYRKDMLTVILATTPLVTSVAILCLTFVVSIVPRYVLMSIPIVYVISYSAVIDLLEGKTLEQKTSIYALLAFVTVAGSFLLLKVYYFGTVCNYG